MPQHTTLDPELLVKPWEGPHGGVPPFNLIKPEMFKPAFDKAMNLYRKAINDIAECKAPPTFDNTIAPLEGAGLAYQRVTAVFEVFTSTMNTPQIQKLEKELTPLMAALEDEIIQNKQLFSRIAQVYRSSEFTDLTPEQKRLTWWHYTNFVHKGAALDEHDKQKLADINQRLASLFTDFNHNVLAEEENRYLLLERKEDLEGLPDSLITAAAAAAAEKGHPGKWLIRNTRSSVEPFLTFCPDRGLRYRAWNMWVTRADRGDRYDNNKIITEILKLRYKRARLLGYPTHAHWRMELTMAKSPDKALKLMNVVWKPAVEAVKKDVSRMQQLLAQEGADFHIQPWDYRFYAEKLRTQLYNFDAASLKPYLQLNKLREGQFWMANRLYGFQFREATDIPVYHPDVRVFEVLNSTGGHVGYWYWDPFARDGKSSGAWMSEYRLQRRYPDVKPVIVSNNSNYLKSQSGQPVLISWDDADTMFHEFGHAIHGLCSDVTYPSLSGTEVARDFVEFPSQFAENWLSTPELLERYARHYKDGSRLPQELIEKIQATKTFNQGFAMVEYLASALVDMKIHMIDPTDLDPREFERETLKEIGMPSEIVMRHRLPHFSHLFSSDAYSAGYYSYLWSEVLAHDAYQAFLEGDGPYDQDVASRLKREVLSRGNTIDPAEAYRAFRGKDPSIVPLLKARGFPVPDHPIYLLG